MNCLFVCLFVCAFVCLFVFVRLCVCLFVCLFVSLSMCLFAYLQKSASLFSCLIVYLSICLSVCSTNLVLRLPFPLSTIQGNVAVAVLEVQSALTRLQEGIARTNTSTGDGASTFVVDMMWSHSCALCHRRLGVLYKVYFRLPYRLSQPRCIYIFCI